jgi:hypothetical protein
MGRLPERRKQVPRRWLLWRRPKRTALAPNIAVAACVGGAIAAAVSGAA